MMRLFLILSACAALFGVGAQTSRGAILSSSTSTPRVGIQLFQIATTLIRPDTSQAIASAGGTTTVHFGSSLVALTVNTVADTVRYDDIDFITPYLQPANVLDQNNINFSILQTPANFPDPPVFKQVMGTYGVHTIFNTFATATPTFTSSSTSPITFNITHFEGAAPVTLSLPDITVSGVYEAVGPVTTVTQPFSFVLRAQAGTKVARSAIPGGPGFGNGFAFTPYRLQVQYAPTTSTPLFDQMVDDVRFLAQKPGMTLNYFIPEPTALGLAGVALAFGGAWRRRRR